MDFSELSNIRMLRATLKKSNADADEVEGIISKLTTIKSEIEEEVKAQEAAIQKKQEGIEQIKNIMSTYGITTDDLTKAFGSESSRKARSMSPKYKYVDLAGVERTWTGQGKLPNALKQLLESNGKSKEDYRI